ncbi:MAG: TIGR03759 family integrating conjugative element protein [Gammaproteobacteria bacterium CG_4_10_14_0_8_um_filter_38_16]|nr:MAG: TIGR03759 family integrating conjugative element protein [Gammaproteobacteria bacterium CG_4_10_14_0_8_um_filter_38_16]PJA04239.1 MAG: TIGR03759 family integrating conjugative element protein [Gammaproteobacteria bacterium CG_4_10_14_0_2_um_filter_38_22]PJB10933.1 MAG: TIGR03759 family integrating conjugative element protein [Gammaproteobacteria bacterium CG_4_9_14_3_um_filter_38_9]
MKNKNSSSKKLFYISFLAFNAFCTSVLADQLQSIDPKLTQNTIIKSSSDQSNALESNAKMWGLTTNNFQHYLWLMKNSPSGNWYKNLDPPEVLALNTTNPEKMMQYAEVQARNMHSRVTQELLFNKIYSQAYRNLYPDEKPIMPLNQANQSDILKAGDRVWLFLGVNTPLGSFAYKNLLKNIQSTPNTVLDIYFVGKNVTKKNIEQWAADMSIPHQLVNKQITLNFGNDRFSSLTKGKPVNLPFVGIVHNNRFQPITLSSVL